MLCRVIIFNGCNKCYFANYFAHKYNCSLFFKGENACPALPDISPMIHLQSPSISSFNSGQGSLRMFGRLGVARL